MIFGGEGAAAAGALVVTQTVNQNMHANRRIMGIDKIVIGKISL
jgi:hypothetical protein